MVPQVSTKKQEITTKQAMRYSRQIMLDGFDLDKQETLMQSRALIIGLGGLGCAAAQYLVASGIGSITLVDDDTVENTNLQRQILHSESSIGSLKVDSAYNALIKLNSEVDISCIAQRQDKRQLLSLLQTHDIILDCSDNLSTRNLLNEVAYESKKPLISGAAIRMEGQILCVSPIDQSACYACVSHFFGEQTLSCVDSGVMSPLVGVIGAMQALEAIKVITGFGVSPTNKLMMFDAMTSSWESFNVNARESCQICSTK